MLRKVLSLVLAVVMLTTLLPTITLAGGTTVDFQQGVGNYSGCEDTYIQSSSAGNNFGKRDVFSFGGNTSTIQYRGLLRFNLSSLPQNALITSATLTLKVGAFNSAMEWNNYLNVYEVSGANGDWIEGARTGNSGATAVDGEPTWNTKAAPSTGWNNGAGGTVAGGGTTSLCVGAQNENFLNYTNIASYQLKTMAVGDTFTVNFNSAGIAALNNWLAADTDNDPATINTGMFLTTKESSTRNYLQVCSADAATATDRPKLSITYTVMTDNVPITAIGMNSPINVTQKKNAVEPVNFAAIPTPNRFIDANTIKWYVNGVDTLQTGLTYAYMPPNQVGAYKITAKAEGTALEESRYVTVTDSAAMTTATPYLYDDCESYQDNPSNTPSNTVPAGGSNPWAENLNKANIIFVQDPLGQGNQVIQFSGAQWAILRDPMPLNKPLIIKGRVLMSNETTPSFSLMLYDPNGDTTGKRLLYFDSNKNIQYGLGTSTTTDTGADWIENQWITYEGVIIPSVTTPNQYSIEWKISGGVTGSTVTVTKRTFTLTDIGASTAKIKFQADTNRTFYIDDINMYPAPQLEADIPGNTNIGTSDDSIVLTFNAPIDVATLNNDPSKVLIYEYADAAEGTPVTAKSITLNPDGLSAVVTFNDGALKAGTDYTVRLNASVCNIYGNKTYNTVYFSTDSDAPAREPYDYFIPVKSVAVSPEKLSVWLDWPATVPIQLAAKVQPTDATDGTLTWESSVPSVATVSSDGTITLVGVGTTTITAKANDGSGGSDSCEFTVTAPKNRAANQKLNLPNLAAGDADRVNVTKALSWPTNVGEGIVAMWNDNKTGAYTVTVDDAIDQDYNQWLDWSKTYDIPITFFAPVCNLTDDNMAAEQKLIEAGCEVQSHTKYHLDETHQNAMKSAETMEDFGDPIDYIEKYTNSEGKNPVKSLAFSYGHPGGSPNISNQYYIAARGVSAYQNSGARISYNYVSSFSMTSDVAPETIEGYIKNMIDPTNIKYGGWTCVHDHSVAGLITLYNNVFGNYLNPGTPVTAGMTSYRDKIWVDTFTNVAMYGQERDTANLTITENSADDIQYTLTDQMDDTVFNYPLTVKIKVPSNWDSIKAIQGGKMLKVQAVEEDGNKYVMVKTVPDRGEVTVVPFAGINTFDGSGVAITNPIVATDSTNTTVTADFTLDNGVQNIKAYLVKYAGKKLTDIDVKNVDATGGVMLTVPKAEAGEEIYLLVWNADMKPITLKINTKDI